jgi:hypothetical protein
MEGELQENPAGGIGPEVMPDDLLGRSIGSLVEEVPYDRWPGKTGDLACRHELEKVVAKGVLIDPGHLNEGRHINARIPGNDPVDGLACTMLENILL